jgi:hypothetical protein
MRLQQAKVLTEMSCDLLSCVELGNTIVDQDWQAGFEEAWAFREDKLYRSHFRGTGEGIYVLDAELFSSVFHQDAIDPRWLNHGVIEFKPTAERPNWVYVSSGLSNAWEADAPDPDGVSGLGCEFLFQCPTQARWALLLMRRMVAFQLLLAAGRFPGKGLLAVWDRIPLRGPIDGEKSQLSSVMLAPATDFPGVQQLPSGQFQFIQFVGITENEAEYARAKGSPELFRMLVAQKAAPVTDSKRASILTA